MEQPRPQPDRPAHRAETDPEIQILIEGGIELARQRRSDIDPATARMIAHALATAPDSPLARFAKTDDISNAEARADYLPLYEDETTPDDVHELIDWLGVHLIVRENRQPPRADLFVGGPRLGNLLWQTCHKIDGYDVDLHIPGDLPLEDEPAMLDRLAPLIRRLGDPFLHFLEMPDVDASASNIEESFHDFYIGTFSSRDAVLAALIEIDAIEEAIHKIAAEYAGAEFVTLDRDDLWERVCDVWEVIESGEEYHVFNR
ncbi:MAG: hypothetical protein AB7I38_16905 [Dehalococcoidia bacterium]